MGLSQAGSTPRLLAAKDEEIGEHRKAQEGLLRGILVD